MKEKSRVCRTKRILTLLCAWNLPGGRSCWGSGQQDASESEADAGSRNPGAKHPWHVGQAHAGRKSLRCRKMPGPAAKDRMKKRKTA